MTHTPLLRLLVILLALLCHKISAADETLNASTLWDVPQMLKPPASVEWGKQDGLVREVYYSGEPYQGKPTRVFAYYAKPEGKGPFPAMLLIHGGGGMAFPEWAKLWAKRGYVALAMDTDGCGPGGVHREDGGPDETNDKFREFTPAEARDMWPYHAAAAAIHGHGLLLAQPEVDKDKIGVTGISWGGYLTCIVAGIDHELKVAVPVYGCGFLSDNSVWARTGSLAKKTPKARQRWSELFDPSQYLANVRCPMLWVNGTNDGAYPLDSYQKSYELVTAPRTLSITINMPHGHLWDQTPIVQAFVDSVLKDGQQLLRLGNTEVVDGTACAKLENGGTPARAELIYTTDSGPWEPRKWQSSAAKIETDDQLIRAKLPETRPITCFLNVIDDRGFVVSSNYTTLD